MFVGFAYSPTQLAKILFLHKVSHVEDSGASQPVEYCWDFDEEKMNNLLHKNVELIFYNHCVSRVNDGYTSSPNYDLHQDGWSYLVSNNWIRIP